MIPKIRFRYSYVYDRRYRDSPRMKRLLKKRGKKYPSSEKILTYIKRIEPSWKKNEKKILREISKIMGLKWKEKEIICYVIGFGRGFSDPLTVKVFKNKNDFVDTLVHEMIHQIQFQNHDLWRKWAVYLRNNYKNKSRMTNSHILLHAVHKEIYLRLFDEKRLKRDIKKCQKYADYKRSWKIVEKEGHENIIKEFRKRIN